MTDVFRRDLLAGKVAAITGGGSGINLTIAHTFVRYGAAVGIIGRRQARLDAAVAELTREGGRAIGAAADVRDYEALSSALGRIAGELGAIDILVCGAAGNFPAPALGMSAQGFKAVVDIDLLGTFNTCRAAYEHLQKPGASVINISAPQAQLPMAYQSHVCAGKAGVDMITRTLAIEWGSAGVRVNAIAPGPIAETEGMSRLTPTAASAAALAGLVPLGRYGRKQEIAELALFLASEAAAYITGAVVPCDGGVALVGSSAWVQALASATR